MIDSNNNNNKIISQQVTTTDSHNTNYLYKPIMNNMLHTLNPTHPRTNSHPHYCPTASLSNPVSACLLVSFYLLSPTKPNPNLDLSMPYPGVLYVGHI